MSGQITIKRTKKVECVNYDLDPEAHHMHTNTCNQRTLTTILISTAYSKGRIWAISMVVLGEKGVGFLLRLEITRVGYIYVCLKSHLQK